MANLFAIELNENQLLVACAKTSGRTFQISHAFSLDISEAKTNAEIGALLKEQLDARSLGRGEVLSLANRNQVEIREFTLPPAPDNELPDLVRFQAKSEFTALGDNWLLDYVPFDGIEGGPRRVLATAASPETADKFSEIFEAAGLKQKRILFGPYAVCNLLGEKLNDGEQRLVINPNKRQIDLTVTDGAMLLATRSVRRQATDDASMQAKKLTGEIRRTLASCAQTLGSQSVSEFTIFAAAAEHESLADHLTETFDVPVRFVEPLGCISPGELLLHESPENVEDFSSLFGALAQEGSKKKHLLDLLNPRKPIVEKKFDQKRATFYGSLAAAVLLFSVFIAWWVLNGQQTKITKLEKQLDVLQEQNNGAGGIPSVDQTIGEVGTIDEWKVGDLNWLDELAEISERFLLPDDAIVDSFKSSVAKDTGRIHLTGRIATIGTDTKLKSALQQRPYEVKDGRTDRLEKEDGDYNFSIDKNLLVERERGMLIREINEMATARRLSATEAENNPQESAEESTN